MADAYQLFVLAVVQRAIADAQGQCSPAVSRPVGEIQREAVAWLTASDEVAALLELAGYEPEPVLRRVRARLPLHPERTT